MLNLFKFSKEITDKKKVFFKFSMLKKEKDFIEKLSQKHGVTQSDILRYFLRSGLKKYNQNRLHKSIQIYKNEKGGT